MDNLRVMFLSKYADATSDMVFEDLAERNYANYHIAFRESIQKLFNNLSVTHCINDIIIQQTSKTPEKPSKSGVFGGFFYFVLLTSY